MSNCLVTGAAGFIGSSLVRRLLSEGHKVRGVDNFATGRRENLAGVGFELIEADLAAPGVAQAACADVEIVFHEAALASVPWSIAEPLETNRANVDATVALLAAAQRAGVRRVVYAASSSAYGVAPPLPTREDCAPKPGSPYAVSKLSGEFYMRCFHEAFGLETVILRYFNVFGPRQDPNSPYSGVLARFIRQMLAGESPTIYGDGEQSRDFVYIADVVAANMLAATAPSERVAGKTFNIALGQPVTVNRAIDLLRGLTGYRGEIVHAPPRHGDARHSLADIRAAQMCLGYEPTTSFSAGLEQTVAWHRAQVRV